MSPPRLSAAAAPALQPEYSAEDRQLLLSTARRAIADAIAGRPFSLPDAPEYLLEPRGVFCSLHCDGALRGCIGFPLAVAPLLRAVAEAATSAALHDPRFVPVEENDLAELQIELSVLSPLRPILPEEIEIGRHGLVISDGMRRGLLLPQVATDHHWVVKTFLEQTCYKAGLAPDAWRHGATLEAFTAEVFSE